ncbi:MAG: rhomboid family intramembrane serine protease [Lachnospiraceae bacterium]|nr:rhomboid family intramembrane serine protease [Lachnospiraceae bacterium]MBP5185073.1 rhomboid family intramembrane serine protease [Lachnospiraceae bacterium]
MQQQTKSEIGRFLASPNHIIVIVNVIVFLMTDLFLRPETSGEVVSFAALQWGRVLNGHEFYRLLTYMFLHGDISHIFGNMAMILLIGDSLEAYFGKLRYTILYFSTGILAGGASMVYNIVTASNASSIGASGAGFGLMGALAAILIFDRGWLNRITLGRLAIYIALSLYTGFRSYGIDNAAHVGGLMAGLLVGWILYQTKNRKRERGSLYEN